MYVLKRIIFFILLLTVLSCTDKTNDNLDLSAATIWVSPSLESSFQETAKTVLVEEVMNRTDLKLDQGDMGKSSTVIVLALVSDSSLYGETTPTRTKDHPEYKKEGYRLVHESKDGKDILWVLGADNRGILYGVGKLLRTSEMDQYKFLLPKDVDFSESPQQAMRGYQFGYRDAANSWDSWTLAQFDQHFREQVLFGANSFENIPFQDPKSSVHFKMDPKIMEVEMSKICDKYQADYWVWTPAPQDLTKGNSYNEGLAKQEDFYSRCPRLNGVFVPGGDPGDNHPSVLLPYLKDLSKLLKKYHPKAGIWVSLQGFSKQQVNYVFKYLEDNDPDWLTGLVYGPQSPPVDLERERLPKKYMHRSYADITHTVRCQYPVKNWDQAFALTLGREPCNPQPIEYARVFREEAMYTDGFIAYSDGSHDDVNKVLWSQLGWDPNKDVRDIMVEYCRFFFGYKVAESAADGILDLEKNWEGPLMENKSISKTLDLWQKLEAENPDLNDKNWRWQQLIMRAYYDAYIQDRLAYERGLETKAYKILANAKEIGADKAMAEALNNLQKADREKMSKEIEEKVFSYADKLYRSIGAQTSVPKYNAAGPERGAILDFIDYPLNNRWWLEDEFKKISSFKTESAKLKMLEFIRTYDSPGEGSFYDNITSANAKHVTSKTDVAINYLWENDGLSRKRLSSQLFQFTPNLAYEGLDPNANYLIRVSGWGEALLRANGERLKPTKYEKEYGEFKEFPVPKELIKDGKLKIAFDKPDEEENVNWRKQSRVTDVWILKQ